MKTLVVCVPLLAFAHLTGVVTAADPHPPSTRGFNATSATEIRKLGDDGDLAAIPYLRKLLAKEAKAGSSFTVLDSRASALRTALAKLGDEEQMQNILNGLRSDNPEVQYVAIQQLARVGGNQAVYSLAQILYSDIGTRAIGADPKTLPEGVRPLGRVLYSPPREEAVRALEQLIEPVPVERQAGAIVTNEHVKQWKQWWEDHKDEYPLAETSDNETVRPEDAGSPASRPANALDEHDQNRDSPSVQ